MEIFNITLEQAKREAKNLANAHRKPVNLYQAKTHFILTTNYQDRPPGVFIENVAPDTYTLADLTLLRRFICPSQMKTMIANTLGEEGEWFRAKLTELAKLVRAMPKVYEQDGLGDKAIVHLHYFKGNMDWWITERDTTDVQHQAFGKADIGHGGEMGYISIAEIIQSGVELDLHWAPKTLAEGVRNADQAS